MQPVGFEVLQRRGAGHRLKVVVKRRDAHVRLRGELVNAQVFGVLALNTLEHAAYQAEVGLSADQGEQRPTAGSQQYVVKNFADDLFAENARIQRPPHHVQQTLNGAEDLFR